ncbi:MAG: hypothetical protein ND895_18600 [Pyrinomonadaceae bacterium]|nr:hypothetical protein [Pyrinomonadaceae bacterium]
MSKHRNRTVNSAKKFPRLPVITVASLVILAIGAVTVLSRQSASPNKPNDHERSVVVADKPAAKSVNVKVAGQDVPVDPKTGLIRPLTQQEAERLAQGLKEMINTSTEGLVEVQNADGSVSVDLEDRFQNVTVARTNPDGSVSTSCVNNPRAAGAFFGIDPKLIENRPKGK